MPTMQERLEALRAKRASETTTDTTTKPAALSMKERLDALRASKAAQAPVVPPVAPVATTAPAVPKPASGPDRWQNVIPQGVNEAASGVIGLGGVAVDMLLNAPRAAAAAVLPRSAYESIYGAPPEVPFTAATEFGADVAGSMRTAAEDVFPKPLAQKDYNAAMSASDGSFLGAVKAAWDNKLGAAQEMAQQAVTTAVAGRAAGIPTALAVMEGGAPEQAGAAFDAEWSQGIPQQSAAYKELAAAIGPDEARRVLRTERMQRTSQLQAAAGVAGGALSAKLGGMELEKALSGQASKIAGIGGIAKQAAMEMPEEAIVQFAGNVAAQNTGNPTLDSLQGVAGAAGAGLVMGGGQSTVVAGAQAAASLLAAKRADVKPTIKFDPKINEALKTPASPAGAQSTVGATTPQTPTPIVPPAAPQTPSGVPPTTTSTLLQQIMTPEQLALHESLQDEAGRMKMLADIKADAEAKRAGWEKAKASMARNAEDRDWLSKNPITSHPMFGEIDKAVRGGATSYRTLAEKVPQISSSVMQAAFKHLESVGAISPYVKGKKREVLGAPTAVPTAAGTIENNVVPPVQPAIQPPVQSDNIVSTQNNNVEQKSVLTLPEVGRIIARETEDVNTPPVIPTAPVQTKTPKVREPRVEPTKPIRLRAPAPAPVEVTVTPTVESPAPPATPVAPPAVESPVAPPVQPQTPVAEAPLPASIGKAGVEAAPPKPALDTWVASADPEDVDIWKGTHDAHAKRNNVKPEDTYVGQVLRGITPTATPTVDDVTFAEKMKLSIPTATPSVPAAQAVPTVQAATTNAPAEVPVTGLTPQTKARRKAAAVPVVEETVVAETPPAKPAKEPKKSKLVTDLEKKAAAREAKRVADEETAKADAAREALKMPSDAELVGAGLSPAEVTLLKKNPEQHRDVLDAVSRGEISTKEGMRPVTDADVAAAKTRPEKDKLQRLKDKYEQVTDAPRKLSPASITNVRKEAIARAYERIKAIAQSPNMGQFDAIPNDPESTKAILGLQAEAQKTPTTEAELAKKLEEQYVANYTRNHPEAKETAAAPVVEAVAPVVASPVPSGVFVNDDGGVFATTGVSESLRGLTSMWRDILKIGQKVYLTTFADLEANKGAFTGEYARILSLNSGDSRSGAGRDGVKAVLPDGSYIIVLNPKLSTSQTLEVLGHELGHAHQEIAFDNADDSTKSKLYAAYDAWARTNAQPTNLAKDMLLSRAPRSQGRKIGATAKPGMTVGQLSNPTYWRSFNEWYADQVARWATTTAVPLTAVEKFFSRLGMAMRTFFNKAHNAKYLPDPRFSAYMDAVTKTAKASPTLDNQPGTVSNIEASASTVTPPPPTTPAAVADYDPLVTDTPSVFSQWYDRGMSLFRNRGNASVDAQAFIEGKAGLESAMLLEAEFAVEHVQRALAEANKGITKATRDMYNVNLLKYLKGDKTATLPAPVVARLEALRKLIDDRSLALIALGLIPKDKIATVLENHGKWLHRDYQVFQLQPGRNNKPGVYKEHHIALAKDGRRHIVNENIEAAKIDMRLPSIADITALAKDAKSKTSDTAEGAKAQLLLWAWRWQLNTEKLDGKDGVVALLKQKAKGEVETGKFIDPEELLHKQAYDYLMAMLDPQFENSPIDTRQEKFNPRHGVYVDDTAISEDRTPMPQWLRNVWGEYKRWDTVSLLTLETQANIISKFVSLSNYKTRLEIAGTIFKATDPRSKKGYALLANKIYGPLNGYYIPEKDLWLIQSANTVSAVDAALGSRELSTNPFLGKIMEVTRNVVGVTAPFGRMLKVMQVLASHLTAGINAFSTAVQLSGALTRPIKSARNIGKSMKLATSSSFAGVSLLGGLIGGALESNTALHKQLLFLTSKNVLHDSVLAADTRRQYKDQLTAEITSMMSNGEWSWNVAKKAIPWAVDRLSRFNSYGDELGKHISWAARVEELSSVFPQKSEEEIWTMAAKHVVATMPSYMHAMPLSRAVGASGVLGAYATFHTEVIRNIYNSMEMATEFAAMGSTEARIYAARELASVGIRVAGVATLNSVIWGPLLVAANAVAGLMPGDDDEEEKKKIEAQREAAMKFNTGEGYAAIRPAMADYVQGHQRFLRVTEDGKVLFTNLQRFDPFIFGAMLEAAQYGDAADFGNIVKSTYADLVGSIPALAGLVGGAAGVYKNDAGTKRNAAAHDMWSAAVEEMGVIYTPGSLKTALRTSKAAEQGVELTPDEKLMDQTGLTVQIFDPKRAASTIAADYDNTHSRPMRLVREQMKEEAETLDFHSATVSKFTIWERAQRKMNNLRKTGLLDEGAIYTAVKSAPMSEGITEAEMVGLVEGMFVLPKYSEQVEKFHKEALVKAGTDQAKLDKVNTLYQTYYKQAAEADKAERAIYTAMGVTVL